MDEVNNVTLAAGADGVIDGDTDSDGRLDVGETWSYTGSYVITQLDLDGEGNAGSDFDIDNTATADSDQTDPVEDSEEVDLEQEPEIAIDKVVVAVDAAGDGVANAVGDVIDYRIDVTNPGNTALDGVTVSDPLLGTLTAVDEVNNVTLAAGADGVIDGDTDSDGRLDVGETWSYTGSYVITQLDLDGEGNAGSDFDIDNTATADSDQTDPVEDSEEVDLEQEPEIAIDKTFAEDSVIAGGAGSSFTLVVTNIGNQTLSGVLIDDVVDSRLTVNRSLGDGGC